jgi:hypothetical protein
MMTDLSGKRVLILGAETEIGRAVTTAVAEAGANVAAVAATSDAEAAFAVQRLARRLSPGAHKIIAQAIDATNEAAVRVMVRQVSKELGGLDALVFYDHASVETDDLGGILGAIFQFGGRELDRSGHGKIILIQQPREVTESAFEVLAFDMPEAPQWQLVLLPVFEQKPIDALTRDAVAAIAGEADSG